MEREIILAKFESLEKCVRRIEDIDCKIIFSIVKNHLCDFREFAKCIQKILG